MSSLLDSLLDKERRGECAWHDGLAGHDSLATINAIHRAAETADAIAAERQARQEMLAEQLDAAITRGDAWATCFFAGKHDAKCKDGSYVTVRDNLGDVLAESLETRDGPSFHDVAAYLLKQAGEGDEAAQALLDRMAAAWVRVNCDE